MGNLSIHYKRYLRLIVCIADNVDIKAFILVVFQNEGLLHGYLFLKVYWVKEMLCLHGRIHAEMRYLPGRLQTGSTDQ